MLKSTYRTAATAPELTPLSAGWTEHKAPTGHTYYYNAETKQSTYTRPAPVSEELLIDYNATGPDQVVQASIKVLDEFHKSNPEHQRGTGQFTGGKSYQDRSRRDRREDRPKSKKAITNFEPWVLVMTKLGRRFVHNTETNESFWKFPSDVMMAVIEMDRVEWQAKQKVEEAKKLPEERDGSIPQTGDTPGPIVTSNNAQPRQDYDSDEYEEVEVTDDEGEGGADPSAKRQRTDFEEPEVPKGPIEYDEDDIAWQLAQMEGDEYEGDEYDNAETADEDEGLPLTDDDAIALFRSLLDETRIDPYSVFDALIESNNTTIIEDNRWIALPNMSSRREAFTNWSRDRIAEQQAREAAIASTKKKQHPRTAYLAFLQETATPKLYWPEFKRKFKKEEEMKDLNLSDKEREKLYREYITKIKAGESANKKDFIALLKSIPQSDAWNRSTSLDDLPEDLLEDLRFYVMRDRRSRDDLIEAHIATLK